MSVLARIPSSSSVRNVRSVNIPALQTHLLDKNCQIKSYPRPIIVGIHSARFIVVEHSFQLSKQDALNPNSVIVSDNNAHQIDPSVIQCRISVVAHVPIDELPADQMVTVIPVYLWAKHVVSAKFDGWLDKKGIYVGL